MTPSVVRKKKYGHLYCRTQNQELLCWQVPAAICLNQTDVRVESGVSTCNWWLAVIAEAEESPPLEAAT
jgi:hypothetical protein